MTRKTPWLTGRHRLPRSSSGMLSRLTVGLVNCACSTSKQLSSKAIKKKVPRQIQIRWRNTVTNEWIINHKIKKVDSPPCEDSKTAVSSLNSPSSEWVIIAFDRTQF